MTSVKTKYPAHWTPVQIAAYELIHGFRHKKKEGAPAWEPFFAKTSGTLSNESNPDYQWAKLGLDDAIRMEQVAGSASILHAHARMLGHICIPVPNPEMPAGDVALLSKFAEWQAAMGKTCEHIRDALEDGRITRKEYQAITSAGFVHMTRFMEFLERVKTLQEGAGERRGDNK